MEKCIVALCLFLILCSFSWAGDDSADSYKLPGRHIILPSDEFSTSLSYMAYVPEDYGKDPDKKWPFVLFLHGVGERGSDVERVEFTGLPAYALKEKYDFVLVAPQCPLETRWRNECPELNKLVDDACKRWNLDESRLYLTGLSMGGFGSWAMACAYPDRFAAVAPICGGGDTEKAAVLKDLPIWAFHGEKDNVVSCKHTIDMIKAIRAAGGKPKMTLYPELGHDSWTATYGYPELYKWMLSQKKAE